MIPTLGELRPWTDPETVAMRRLPMRVPTTAYDTADAARAGDESAAHRRSLNGSWSFRLFDTPDAAVLDPGAGQTVAVPGNWTMQDTGDLPHYTNVQMPFDGPPPRLPERNPTGVYQRSFTVPAGWARGRRIVLHVGGAESVHAVFVNGEFAGYGTDSRLASEYDITALTRRGRNDVAIVVMRYSAHSYVEDQDQWWMAGLHREVYVEARALTRIGNLRCDADLDVATGAGSLRVTSTVAFHDDPAPGWSVRTTLERLDGARVGKPVTAAVPHSFATPYVFTGHHAISEHTVPKVQPWSAEQPYRYRIVAELLDPSGTVTEAHTQLIGFRHVAIQNRRVLVNGQPVWFFGVNRHDHHPERGKAVTVDDMRADLLQMKRHNVNAVRASHYPNDPRLLDLCDELGLYVVDEANIESHAYNTSLCNDDRYRSAWLSRGARMVERDVNHPCILFWSLGNESGYGANHDALAGWIRRNDPSRLLHYEGAVFHDGWADGGRLATDVVCPMYAPIEAIQAYGRDDLGDRPLILCEYSHAMGNSNGSLSDYWDVITSTPGLQGGFIWEWKDHGLVQHLADGRTRLAHGGLFGDTPNDGNFVADGLVSAHLEPHPAMREVAWVHRPVTVTAGTRRNTITVTNRRSFSGLGDLRAEWQLLVDGEPVASGRLRPGVIAAHESAQLPLPAADPPGRSRVDLTVRWTQLGDTPWAPAGHLVAWDQVTLRDPKPTAARATARSRSRAGELTEPTELTELTEISELTTVEQLLVTPVTLNLWRAAVDNDGFKLMPELAKRIRVGGMALTRWLEQGIDSRRPEELVGHAVVRTVDDDGSVVYAHTVTVPDDLADLPRIGVLFALPKGFDTVRWVGRGPHENYPDRRASAMFGTWEQGVDAPPYLVPQEFGLRTDVRRLELADGRGRVVRVDVLGDPMHCSVTHFTPNDLFTTRHEVDLVPRDELVVCLDAAHRGLGTASCGPDVLPQYRLAAGEYRFSYRLSMR